MSRPMDSSTSTPPPPEERGEPVGAPELAHSPDLCVELWGRLQTVLCGEPATEKAELANLRHTLEQERTAKHESAKKKDHQIRKLRKEIQKRTIESESIQERMLRKIKNLRDKVQCDDECTEKKEKMEVEIKELEKEKASLNERISEAQRESADFIAKQETRLRDLEAEKAKLKKKVKVKDKQLDAQIRERDDRIRSLKSEVSEAKTKSSFLKFQNVTMKSHLEKKVQVIESLQAKVAELSVRRKTSEKSQQTETQTVASECKASCSKDKNWPTKRLGRQASLDVQQKIAATEVIDWEAQAKKLKHRIAFLEAHELAILRGKLDAKNRLLIKVQNDLAVTTREMEKQNSELECELKISQEQLAELREQNENLEKEFNALKDKHDETNKLFTQSQNELAESKQQMERQILDFESERKSYEQKLTDLTAYNKKCESRNKEEVAELKKKVDEEHDRGDNLVRYLKESEEKITLWISQGKALESQIEELKKENAGLREMPMVSEYGTELHELKEESDKRRRTEEKVRQLEEGREILVTQLKSFQDGVLILTKQTYEAEKQVRESDRQLADLRSEYKRVLTENVDLQQRSKDYLGQIERLRNAVMKESRDKRQLQTDTLSPLRQELDDARKSGEEKDGQIETKDKEIDALKDKVNLYDEEVKKLKTEMDDLKNMATEKDGRIELKENEISALQEKVKLHEEEMKKMKSQTDDSRKKNATEKEAKEKENNTLKLKIKSQEEELKKMKSQLDEWKKKVGAISAEKVNVMKKLDSQLAEWKKKVTSSEGKDASHAKAMRDTKQKLDSQLKQLDELRNKLKALHVAKDKIAANHAEDSRKFKETMGKLSAMTSERDQLVLRLKSLKEENENLVKKQNGKSDSNTSRHEVSMEVDVDDEMDERNRLRRTINSLRERNDVLEKKIKHVYKDRDSLEKSIRRFQKDMAGRNQTAKMLKSRIESLERENCELIERENCNRQTIMAYELQKYNQQNARPAPFYADNMNAMNAPGPSCDYLEESMWYRDGPWTSGGGGGGGGGGCSGGDAQWQEENYAGYGGGMNDNYGGHRRKNRRR